MTEIGATLGGMGLVFWSTYLQEGQGCSLQQALCIADLSMNFFCGGKTISCGLQDSGLETGENLPVSTSQKAKGAEPTLPFPSVYSSAGSSPILPYLFPLLAQHHKYQPKTWFSCSSNAIY